MNCKIEVFTCPLKSHQQHHYHHHAWTITTVFIVCVEFAMNFMWQKRKEIDIQIRAKRSDEKTMIWMTEQTKKMWTTTKQTNGKHNEMPQMNDRATTTNIIRRSSKAARRCDVREKRLKSRTQQSRARCSQSMKMMKAEKKSSATKSIDWKWTKLERTEEETKQNKKRTNESLNCQDTSRRSFAAWLCVRMLHLFMYRMSGLRWTLITTEEAKRRQRWRTTTNDERTNGRNEEEQEKTIRTSKVMIIGQQQQHQHQLKSAKAETNKRDKKKSWKKKEWKIIDTKTWMNLKKK